MWEFTVCVKCSIDHDSYDHVLLVKTKHETLQNKAIII